ncbi:MAG: hypothetical protein HN742_02380 [Lentisphaerae bacterium]|jgi:argininosuccinate lyase|nr:hypothetical protein [Lentisphaerota bacterium]MBT5605301.1 hypothetical protein [Lentisphaerota bacterium]MBT7057549.1 hypothetical protein [Lentisphaerota bacterium]MBT7840685.1 hypothetical protein [Lentisphaerota bacterium]
MPNSQSLSDYYRQHVPDAALVSKGQAPWVLFRTYECDLTRRIDQACDPSAEFLLDSAWATMEMKVGMIPPRNHAKVAAAMLELWNDRPAGKYYGHKGMQGYVTEKHGIDVGGDMMIGRTNPSQRQQMAVRRKLLKMLALMHNFQQVLLETAQANIDTVMPGYTHIRHAQPTTFGHYLMSVHDPIERAMQTLEDGYHAMSLNELGCGALAGTSWPIDRELVSRYLGLEGLIENTNDAVSYTDGYVLLATGVANIMAVMTRFAQELEYWSGLEYDFLDFEIGAGSFMMPNKRSNQSILERTAEGASRALGALTEVTSMGMKVPHGDVQPMAYCMAEGTLRTLEQLDRFIEPYLYVLPTMIVHKERMLTMAREGYSCSTELANQLVRTQALDYRTAHEVVHRFVVASAKQSIPSREADLAVFQEAAEAVTGKQLEVDQPTLRNWLDPVHFVSVTNSRGGVAPDEVARMITDQTARLEEARERLLKRLKRIETGREQMLTDLRALAQIANNQ